MSFTNEDYHEFMKKQYKKEAKAAQLRLARTQEIQQNRIEHSKPLEKKVEPKVETVVEPVQRSFDLSKVKYVLMDRANTYAKGVEALRNTIQFNDPHPRFGLKDWSEILRPLTFKENIEARVIDYESNTGTDARLRLFNVWLDSCSGIAYKKDSTKFKIIPECKELITIDSSFNQNYLPVDYDSLKGVELESAHSTYNDWLIKQEVLEQPAWNTVVDDKHLLKTYVDIVFNEKQQNKLMGFWIRQNTQQDELRALCVDGLGDYSDAVGSGDLGSIGCFARVAPK